jgi:hypothetical protein
VSLLTTRLDVAVRISEAAVLPSVAGDGPLTGRLTAFDAAYRAVSGLPEGDEGWAAEALAAAWHLVESAHPHGAPIADLVEGVLQAHQVVMAVADRPLPDLRGRPRRDA